MVLLAPLPLINFIGHTFTMAKYAPGVIPPFVGTHEIICIYKRCGKYYSRRPSSLDGQRVKTDPAFKKTMEWSALLVKGSAIGSKVYAALSADRKVHALYRKLTGEAMQMLRAFQWKEEDIIDFLLKRYGQAPVYKAPPRPSLPFDTLSADTVPLTNPRSIRKFVRDMELNAVKRFTDKQREQFLQEMQLLKTAVKSPPH